MVPNPQLMLISQSWVASLSISVVDMYSWGTKYSTVSEYCWQHLKMAPRVHTSEADNIYEWKGKMESLSVIGRHIPSLYTVMESFMNSVKH